ncbi:CIR protein PIR protein [Plasmodium vinckei brucechwatti]|uniref:CIR protein PIR protein n=1 Tax=Plasmodium vinckei brucechwatti TaxID=119398 RepID=A0A6V7S4P8_PLAVN|nr:CIR protein PIR protein [Plasmodium vinckei brucechwatti]
MSNSSYDIKDVYSVFKKIDGYFYYQKQEGGGSVEHDNKSIYKYCPYSNTFNSGYCNNYLERARSGVINLLENLEKYNLGHEKLAEYAILFLSYKLKQHSQQKSTDLNKVYTNHIKNNNYYNKKIKGNGPTYKDIIDKKKDLMNIKEISKFNGLFSILFSFYNEINKNKLDCTKYSEKANDFAKNFENLNEDSSINGNTSYSKLLSTLSDDYNNVIKNCTDFPTLPKVKTPPSKLIPVLSTFPVIPVFLGIAYKYSLFGVDKLFQREYLRKKLKKVKKKLKLNI